MEQGNDITNTQINAPVSVPEQNNVMTQGVSEKKKGGKGMLYGMVFCMVLAIGGIGFGVWAMMDGNNQMTKLNEQITKSNNQITTLNEQLAECNAESDVLDDEMDESTDEESDKNAVVELNGDMALDLLREAITGKQMGYGVAYANVYAKYNGDDKVSYWVKYWPSHIVSKDVEVAYDIIFTLNDAGGWDFELPGFTGYGPELTQQYTVLRKD